MAIDLWQYTGSGATCHYTQLVMAIDFCQISKKSENKYVFGRILPKMSLNQYQKPP